MGADSLVTEYAIPAFAIMLGVQLARFFGWPDAAVKPAVYFTGFLVALVGFYNPGVAEFVVRFLGLAAGAMGTYDVLKTPIKAFLPAKSDVEGDGPTLDGGLPIEEAKPLTTASLAGFNFGPRV